MNKKVFEFVLRMEVEDGRLSLAIQDLNEIDEEPSSFIEFEGPLSFSIDSMAHCCTITDTNLETRWDITYIEK